MRDTATLKWPGSLGAFEDRYRQKRLNRGLNPDNAFSDRMQAQSQAQNQLRDLRGSYEQYVKRKQDEYNQTTLADGSGFQGRVEQKQKQMKRVFEYVVYYTPTADDLTTHPDIAEAMILDGKLMADCEQTAKTKVIRMIPTTFEAVIDKVKVEIRAFR